jgi:hypothetical protein
MLAVCSAILYVLTLQKVTTIVLAFSSQFSADVSECLIKKCFPRKDFMYISIGDLLPYPFFYCNL